ASAPAARPAAVRPAASSWTADRRELAVGDVITLFIDDAVIASARRSQGGRDETGRELGFSLTPPAPATTTAASFGDSRRASSSQTGDMSRTSALRTTVAVRITARNADGTYQVKGLRNLDVDKNRQEISVEGVLRPQDITMGNEASGDRLADARITVKQKGRLGKTRGGIIGRILGLVWP
ncbi:MAG: flagellar basal body L-ring protein FlgH, partial [Gemmatimonadaceae bacterium]|nr:flagellar basal body L-ring protein FlgH [Gemmatimonadaceae bacterium]